MIDDAAIMAARTNGWGIRYPSRWLDKETSGGLSDLALSDNFWGKSGDDIDEVHFDAFSLWGSTVVLVNILGGQTKAGQDEISGVVSIQFDPIAFDLASNAEEAGDMTVGLHEGQETETPFIAIGVVTAELKSAGRGSDVANIVWEDVCEHVTEPVTEVKMTFLSSIRKHDLSPCSVTSDPLSLVCIQYSKM